MPSVSDVPPNPSINEKASGCNLQHVVVKYNRRDLTRQRKGALGEREQKHLFYGNTGELFFALLQ